MTNYLVINRLRNRISTELRPLITAGYTLLDAPYYHNIGDVLIWQGIHDFCHSLQGRDYGTSNITTCLFPNLPKDVTILLMGGGNFGDLWRMFQDFRLKVIRRYPNNRIIMFPQSVWYENQNLITADAAVFETHKDLHLCARDNFSMQFMLKHFAKCNIHLVPDMAFYINPKKIKSCHHANTERKLYLKRIDKEFVRETVLPANNSNYDIRDWPSYERADIGVQIIRRLQGIAYRSKKMPILNGVTASFADYAAQHLIRKHLVNVGMQFLSQYSEIVTTRLHTMILGILLDIPVSYIDNTSRKLSAYADTWLNDLETVKPYQK